MKKYTRMIEINRNYYCAYCGKLIKDNNYHITPERPCICDCENAKAELALYDTLAKLYTLPIANNLVEMKVNAYKDALISGRECPSAAPNFYTRYYNTLTVGDASHIDTVVNELNNVGGYSGD